MLKLTCSTALWRGYQAIWKIENNELLLIDVYLCADKERSILHELFEVESPVKARWYTGKLFIQHGDMIKYSHSGFERYFEEETIIQIEQGISISQEHFVNGYRNDDRSFLSNPDSIKAEVHRRINWEEIPKFSQEYKVYVDVKIGKIDSLTIILSRAPELYVQKVQKILDDFPKLRKFYSRGDPIEKRYIFPVIFSHEQREKFTR